MAQPSGGRLPAILIAAILTGSAVSHAAESPSSTRTVDRDAIRRDRVGIILPQAMAAHGIDMWLVFARENAEDPILPTLGVDHIVARGALVFWRDEAGFHRTAIAASYDVDGIQKSGLYDDVISYRQEGIKPHLAELIRGIDPKVIAVNRSRDVTMADGLTAGMEGYLEEALGRRYTKRFVPSERLVVSLLGRKLPAEIEAITDAVEATQRIIAEALTGEVINPGVTSERMLDNWMRRRAEELGYGVAFGSVVTGPTRGHSTPTDKVIGHGDLIRIDWGATSGGYAADIQRTAYVLRITEKSAPEWVRKLWQDTLAANRAAIDACRPGNTGNDVDVAARALLAAAGHPDYPHGTGHAIGQKVHDVGPMLGPDWPERYGAPVFFAIEEGQVFAIEPIIYTVPPQLGYEIHLGLEEDVIVEKDAARIIGTPQTELILVPAGPPRHRASLGSGATPH